MADGMCAPVLEILLLAGSTQGSWQTGCNNHGGEGFGGSKKGGDVGWSREGT